MYIMYLLMEAALQIIYDPNQMIYFFYHCLHCSALPQDFAEMTMQACTAVLFLVLQTFL